MATAKEFWKKFHNLFQRFFWCRLFLKSLLIVLQYCFCFMFWYFGHQACRKLAPWPGIKPTLLALGSKVLTSGCQGSLSLKNLMMDKNREETKWYVGHLRNKNFQCCRQCNGSTEGASLCLLGGLTFLIIKDPLWTTIWLGPCVAFLLSLNHSLWL